MGVVTGFLKTTAEILLEEAKYRLRNNPTIKAQAGLLEQVPVVGPFVKAFFEEEEPFDFDDDRAEPEPIPVAPAKPSPAPVSSPKATTVADSGEALRVVTPTAPSPKVESKARAAQEINKPKAPERVATAPKPQTKPAESFKPFTEKRPAGQPSAPKTPKPAKASNIQVAAPKGAGKSTPGEHPSKAALCKMTGCGKPSAYAMGFCRTHYQQFRRKRINASGAPLTTPAKATPPGAPKAVKPAAPKAPKSLAAKKPKDSKE